MSHPDEPPVSTIAAAPSRTRHPPNPPDAHIAQRAGSLPGPSGRPCRRRAGPALAGGFWHSGPAASPSTAAPAHLPLWAVVAMVAGTVVLSVATTLITLAVERMRRTRHTPAAEPESSTSAAEPEDTQAAVPSKHCEDRAKPPDKASSGTTPTPTRPDIGPNPIAWLRLILDGVASDDP